MIFLKNLPFFKSTKKENRNDFSDFFTNTNSETKAKVIRKVLREANQEQRELVKRYEQRSKPDLGPSLN